MRMENWKCGMRRERARSSLITRALVGRPAGAVVSLFLMTNLTDIFGTAVWLSLSVPFEQFFSSFNHNFSLGRCILLSADGESAPKSSSRSRS